MNGALVGRDEEMERVDRLLARTAAGEPVLATVSGEPGIGKTRLLSVLTERAEAAGFLAVGGSAAEFEQDVPFGLVVDGLDPHLAGLDPRAYERLQADRLGELAGVFPALRDLSGAVDFPATAAERFRTHHAVRELLERLAATRPLLLVLDDLHWADGASLELVMHLLRRPPDAPVLVALGFRAGRLDAGVARALEAAGSDGRVESFALAPLAESDAARLLASSAVGDVQAHYRASGGNPFYLLELARRREGAGDTTEGVPAAVAAAISSDLAGLGEAARRLAQAGAVAGASFDLDLATRMADIDEAVALAAVDELAAADLIAPAHEPRSFSFRHPLVRNAIYEGVSPGARLAAHERCAALLAERGVPAEARAHHVEQSARPGDAEAIALLTEAGQAAADRAPSSAARWFGSALRLAGPGAERFQRLGLLTGLSRALGATGQLAAAREAMEEAMELLPPEAAAVGVRMVVGCAKIDVVLGDYDGAQNRLTAALGNLEEEASAERVALLIGLSVSRLYRADFEGVYEWARRADEAAAAGDEPVVRGAAAAALALAGAFTGRIGDALEALERARGLIDPAPDEGLALWVTALSQTAGAELYMDNYADAMEHARRGLRIARATGQGELVPELYPTMATAAFMTGDTQMAVRYLDDSVEGAHLLRDEQTLSWSLFNRAIGALMVGEIEQAQEIAAQSAAIGRGSDPGLIGASAGAIRGAILLEAGDPAGARDAILSAGGEEVTLIPGVWRLVYMEQLVRARLALGDPDGAGGTVERMRGLCEAFDLSLAHLMADRAAANVALASEEAEKAVGPALRAVGHAERAGAVPELAISREVAGRALAAAGDSERAAGQLGEAAAMYGRLGAQRYRDRAERELRKLGHRIHRRSKPGDLDAAGVASLTGRELEVASLVVDRRTNKEIAAELFLGIKTVETHMRNIFRKLGVTGRAEVARALEQAAAK